MTINEHCFGFFQKANFKLGFPVDLPLPRKPPQRKSTKKEHPGGRGLFFGGGVFRQWQVSTKITTANNKQ